MAHKKCLILILGLFLITGCAANEIKKTQNNAVTRVYISENCADESKVESLGTVAASLFLGPVIEAGIKGIGEAIKKAGEDKSVTVNGMESTSFYKVKFGKTPQEENRLGLNMGCLDVYHGTLFKADNIKQERKMFEKRYSAIHETVAESILRTPAGTKGSIIFSNDIRFYIQYKIEFSKDKTAIRFIPLRALTGKRIGKKQGSKTDLVLVTSLHTPSKNGLDNAFAIANSNFEKVPENKYFSESELEGMRSGWLPLPGVPQAVQSQITADTQRRQSVQTFDESIKDLEKQIDNEKDPTKSEALKAKMADTVKDRDRLTALINQFGETPYVFDDNTDELTQQIQNETDKIRKLRLEFKLASIKQKDSKALQMMNELLGISSERFIETAPISVKVSLTETQEGNQFLVKLGSYLAENNATIAEPIVNSIDPVKRKEAKATEQEEEDKLRIEAIEAVANYEEENAKTGTERSESKVRVNKIKASQACRKLRAIGQADLACIGYGN